MNSEFLKFGAFKIFFLQIYLCLILILSAFSLSAQKTFQPGYIVNNNNDTIYGSIRDRKDAPFAKIYNKIRFKNGKDFTKKYSPEKINGYKAGERLYESLWLDIKADFLWSSYWSIPGVGEKRFVKVIIKDYLCFYQLEFLDPDSDKIEAIPLFKRQDENQLIRVTQGIFGLRKNSLRDYFNDCSELIERLDNGELKSPAEIVIYYNRNCGIR